MIAGNESPKVGKANPEMIMNTHRTAAITLAGMELTPALSVLLLAWGLATTTAGPLPSMPIAEVYQDSIRARWNNKAVFESRVIDGMEDAATWQHAGAGTMALTEQRAKEGKRSLRIACPTKGKKAGGEGGRPWGAAIATRKVSGENWQEFNRLSFWVYPDLPGFNVVSLCVVLRNDGMEKVPNMWDRNGRNFVLLKNRQWNRVVMEIAHLGRDKVVGVEFSYRQQGSEPGTTETAQFDFDLLELQQVVADHFEGWNVAPRQIAYSHTGYPAGFSKKAIGDGRGRRNSRCSRLLRAKRFCASP